MNLGELLDKLKDIRVKDLTTIVYFDSEEDYSIFTIPECFDFKLGQRREIPIDYEYEVKSWRIEEDKRKKEIVLKIIVELTEKEREEIKRLEEAIEKEVEEMRRELEIEHSEK